MINSSHIGIDEPRRPPQRGPFADPNRALPHPATKPAIGAGLGAGVTMGALSRFASCRWPVSLGIGMATGMAVAGAILTRFGRVADDIPLHPAWRGHPGDDQVRVLTWNIRGAGGSGGGLFRPDVRNQIVRTIEELDPDVVVLQEVDRVTARSFGHDVAAEIAAGVHASDWSFANRYRLAGGDYGQVLITRNGYRVDDDAAGRNRSYVVPLTMSGAKPRIAHVSSVSGPDGRSFTVVDTHLSSGDPPARNAQARQLGAIADAVQDGRPVPGLTRNGSPVVDDSLPRSLVLAGDLNANPQTLRRPELLRPEQRGLTDVFSAVGVGLRDARRATRVGGGRLDHIFVGRSARVEAASVIHAPFPDSAQGWRGLLPQEWVSDHDAVVADLVFEP